MLKVKGDRLYYRSALQRSKHDCLTAHQGIYSATPTMWPREAVTRCQQQTWDLAVLFHVDTNNPHSFNLTHHRQTQHHHKPDKPRLHNGLAATAACIQPNRIDHSTTTTHVQQTTSIHRYARHVSHTHPALTRAAASCALLKATYNLYPLPRPTSQVTVRIRTSELKPGSRLGQGGHEQRQVDACRAQL